MPTSTTSIPNPHVDLLVVGAGPTGLTAAAEAARFGLSVRIIERRTARSTKSKALVNHARTLEAFEVMGVSEAILASGVRFAALNAHIGTARHHTRIDLLNQPWGDTDYPFWLSIPQYETERVLEDHLRGLGVTVEWGVSLEGFEQDADRVQAQIRHADGTIQSQTASWLVGCDGGRSTTRTAAGITLERISKGTTFVLADILTTSDLIQNEGHTFLHPDGLLLIVPMPTPNRFRIIAHMPSVPDAPGDAPLTLDAPFFDALIQHRAGVAFGSHSLTWTSQFRLAHGQVERYRKGRVFLAGDAAHIHSPVGGQGLNTSVQDAHNLVWKLALAERAGHAEPNIEWAALLDSYEAERHQVAASMVTATARATRVLTTRSPLLKALRQQIVRVAVKRAKVQARLSRGVGMLNVRYGASPILGTGGMSGMRLPNPKLKAGGRLHRLMDPKRHTWLLINSAETDPPGGLPTVRLSDSEFEDPSTTGFPSAVPFAILVRPDRYIAGSGPQPEAIWAEMGERLGGIRAFL